MADLQVQNTEAPRDDLTQVGDLLDAARKYSESALELRAPLDTCTNAIGACVDLLKRSRARFAEIVAASGDVLDQAAKTAVASLTAGDVRSRASAATDAATSAKQAAMAALRSRVVGEFKDEAAKLGGAAADSLAALQKAIDAAQLLAVSYRALQQPAGGDVADVLREGRLTEQIKAGGVGRLRDVYQGLSDAGGKDAQLIELEDSSEIWLLDVLRGATPGVSPQERRTLGTNDQAVAAGLLDAYARARTARLPKQIKLARMVQSEILMPAWYRTAGVHGTTVSPQQMGRARAGGVPLKPYALLDDWAARSFTVIQRGGIAQWGALK